MCRLSSGSRRTCFPVSTTLSLLILHYRNDRSPIATYGAAAPSPGSNGLCSVQLLNHRDLAVGDTKSQPLRIALRGCSALGDHDRILASGLDGSRHASPQ